MEEKTMEELIPPLTAFACVGVTIVAVLLFCRKDLNGVKLRRE